MSTVPKPQVNVKQAVPFFWVTNMDAALRFYVDGLGFTLTHRWDDDGKLRWCSLRLGDATIMLQEYRRERVPSTPLGQGLQICFTCEDAISLYREFVARGIAAKRPFVGNRMWVTEVADPDGYQLFFESPTDAPEESAYLG